MITDTLNVITLRASSTPRFMQCPGSEFLPHLNSSGDAARLGTAAHVLAADIVRGVEPNAPQVAALHEVALDELRSLERAAAAMWEGLAEYFPEPFTELALPALTLRGGSATATLSGTADVVSRPGDGTLRVGDWKSGWREGNHAAQLKTYALLALRSSGINIDGDIGIDRVYVAIFWMRNREVEGVWYDRATLEAWEQMLIEQLDAGAAGTLQLGEGCGYCPVSNCPALRQQVAMFREDEAELEISGDNVVQLHHMRTAIERRCKDVAAAVSHYVATEGPFPAGDGRELAMVEQEKGSIRFSDALPLLVEKLGEDTVMSLATISKTAVEGAVKAGAARGNKGKDVEEFIGQLGAANAIDKSVSRFPRVVKVAA